MENRQHIEHGCDVWKVLIAETLGERSWEQHRWEDNVNLKQNMI
jgi:hypothetical protein